MIPMTISSGQCVQLVTKWKSIVWVPVLVLVFLPTLAGLLGGCAAGGGGGGGGNTQSDADADTDGMSDANAGDHRRDRDLFLWAAGRAHAYHAGRSGARGGRHELGAAGSQAFDEIVVAA